MKLLKKGLMLFLFAVVAPVAALAGPVNINTADAETISNELQGVGMSKAQAIVSTARTTVRSSLMMISRWSRV